MSIDTYYLEIAHRLKLGTGKFVLAFQGGLGKIDIAAMEKIDSDYEKKVADAVKDGKEPPAPPTPDAYKDAFDKGARINAGFSLSAIENLSAFLGFSYTLPATLEEPGIKYTYNAPIAIGLSAGYNMGDFRIRTRFEVQLADSKKAGSADPVKGDTKIKFDLYPTYQINSGTKAGLGLRLRMNMPNEGDTAIGFGLFPHINLSSGPGVLRTGFWVTSDNVSADTVVMKWQIPLQINFSL